MRSSPGNRQAAFVTWAPGCGHILCGPACLVLHPGSWLVSLVISLFDSTGELQQRVARLWSQMILWTVGAKVQLEGFEHIDTSKPQVYVVNHLSALDIPVLYTHLPFQFRILAKKELFRYPFMGWHLRRSGQIPVVLENPKAPYVA